jgi:hypothetical protein
MTIKLVKINQVVLHNFNNIDFVNFRALVFWWRKNNNSHKITKSHQTLIDKVQVNTYKIMSY